MNTSTHSTASTATPPTGAGVIDPVDTAYLAIGAMKAWEARSGTPELSQLDYVSDVIQHAQLLADKWLGVAEEFPGVWAYEVAEDFGERFGAAILAGQTPDANTIVDELIASAMR